MTVLGLRCCLYALILNCVLGAITLEPAFSAEDRSSIRAELKKTAAGLFRTSKNHCKTLADVADAARSKASTVPDYLEDLRLVLIGEDWLRRKEKRGPYYIGIATNDSGFKSELKDSSPQVEHAMAAIYFAKVLPPGGVGAKGSFLEFLEAVGRKDKPNTADMLLFGYGEDLGDRLKISNMPDFPKALQKTLCD